MDMTLAQRQTLKAFIAATPAWAVLPKNDDSASFIAAQLNLNFSPSFTVWKTNVPINQVGDKFNGTELSGLTSLNHTRLQTVVMLGANGVNPSLPDRRQFFDDIFSGAGGAITRANLLVLWKRFATSFEKLFATGTGTDAAPATLVLEGAITYQDISSAWNS